MPNPQKQAAPSRRRRKPVTIAGALGRMTRDLCARQGFAQAEVVTRWRDIIGPAMAARTLPDRLTFRNDDKGGTLHIVADGAFALELQHLAPQVVERINSYFGFPAIARIAIRQAPMAIAARRRPRAAAPTAETRKAATELAAPVRDPTLRQALESLGEAVLGAANPGRP